MKKILMSKGARTIVEVCAGTTAGEQAVIVTEPEMLPLAEAIAAAVYAVGAEPLITLMTPRASDGQEPPPTVAAAMKASQVFFNVVRTSITHTRATRDAAAAGARGMMMTQFTEEMLIHGGIEADFRALAPRCQAVAAAMAGARTIRLTSPHGTDLTLSADGRRGNALTCLISPGHFTTVPTIEANVSPLEGSAQGTIVADASIPYIGIGLLRQPVTATVERGMIVAIQGGPQADQLAKNLASKQDPQVYNVAELGVGLNPHCRFIGSMLEDEGVDGSVHIGIGTNITLGGHIKAACHYDLIMTGATIVADGRTVLERGEVRV
jgi:leucyl aminopeptidase (aminopeptidase T)